MLVGTFITFRNELLHRKFSRNKIVAFFYQFHIAYAPALERAGFGRFHGRIAQKLLRPAVRDGPHIGPSYSTHTTTAPMSDTSPEATDEVSPSELLFDPGTLRDREGVRFTEEEAIHEDRDHCNTDRAVVGVTNDAGEVLLAVHKEESVAMLPHGEVGSGDDWAAVAREKIEITTDLLCEIDDVEAVREIDHFVEGEDEPHSTTYGVVFRASLAADAESAHVEDPSHDENEHWDAEWFATVPENLPGGGLVEADVRLFVD
jgi:hypothetical protein